MKRIGILTAGGDTPALNATILGAVQRANQLRVEVFGFIKGFSGLLNPRVPHVHLNPLFTTISELDPTYGGTILGASRDYVDGDDVATCNAIADRLNRLGVEGLVCIGGDGTLYDLQKHAVIACAEGVVNEKGEEWGAEVDSTDPAGNKILTGAGEALRSVLIRRLGDSYFTSKRRNESARAAIFTRKVGHTQRGGRPILFDRFYGAQLGGHAVDLLLEGHVNGVSILMWDRERGFHLAGVDANDFPARWGLS